MKKNLILALLCIATITQTRVFTREATRKLKNSKVVQLLAYELKKTGNFDTMHGKIAKHHEMHRRLARPRRRG